MSDALDQAGDLIDQNLRSLAPEAVASQVLLMTVVSAGTVIVFNVLRPKNKIIYEPKVKYHVGDKPPPRISDSLFGWLPPLIHTKEPELVDKIGLDAAIFLRFLRMMRWLFSGVAIITCAILIPINLTYNLKNVDSKKRDILSMLTIRDVQGNFLYVHVAVTYLVTFFLVFVVYRNWVAVIRLRRQWFRSPEYSTAFYARTLAITHVPRKLQTDEGLKVIMDSTRMPYPTTSVHIGRRVGKLPELIEYHNNTVRELERVLVKYLKGGKIGKRRPTIRIGGFLGMGGRKEDAIDHLTNKLKRSEHAIEEYRAQIDTRKAENYGFASLAAVPYAHIVAEKLAGKKPKGCDVLLAPNPRDIIWANMSMSDGEIARKKMLGFIWLAFVCFINTIPLFFISILANLETLSGYVHFLDSWKQASTSRFNSFTIVSGVLPPAVSAMFGYFLPIIMRMLTKYMGALTHSRLDRAVVARYFFFLVISQLIIFSLISVLFSCVQIVVKSIGKDNIKDVLHNLNKLSDINYTYINQSSYWLTYFPLRGFLAVFDLAQIINLVWLSIKTRLFGRTPRDIREWTQPPEFQFAIYYSNILFMGAVGLVFAPLAPLVVVAAAAVFWMESFIYKYNLMFVAVSKVETGGRLWNVIVNRLLFCIVLMQALMVLTIGLQYGFKSLAWLSTIPPILIVFAFKVFTNRRFDRSFRYFIPTEDELREAKVHSERADNKGNRLEKRFGHPALHADLFTPMLHAKMMPLLGQVYSGKISNTQTKLDEYGGKGMDAQVVGGGLKIAAIKQHDLEYDPLQYQRDRGELDWDARSIASTDILNDGATTLQHSKSGFYAPSMRQQPSIPGYDRYLASGPGGYAPSEIELSRMDTVEEPLLSPRGTAHFASPSAVSLPQSMYQSDGYTREAPIHRPQQILPSGYSSANSTPVGTPGEMYASQNSYYPPQPHTYHQQHQSGGGEQNFAGRGTFRH